MWPARSIGSVPMRQILRKDRSRSWSVPRIDQLRLAWSPPEWVVATSCFRSPVATTASWDLDTLIYSVTMIEVGFQAILFALLSRAYAVQEGLFPKSSKP